MKTSKRFRILALLLGGGIVVASSACGVDALDKSTAPSSASHATTPVRTSPFVPTAAQKALIGVTDGTYRVTFDPQQNQVFSLGPNRLEIPANAVCKLGSSSYGPAFWNSPCSPETGAVQLTVTVRNASSDHPSVDFSPAMRFNPQTNVQLFIYVPNVNQTDARNWIIEYCANGGSGSSSVSGSSSGSGSTSGWSGQCVNEALIDPDLRTYVDYRASVLFRRLKHFSRYQVDGSGYINAE
ncbi:MAG: hypothetical protein JF589_09450 [Gemmatimonadetes bacterium]|nr:hypothetical protein [Gemmatimonadota bacterium]